MTTVIMIRENDDEGVYCYYYSDSEVAEAVERYYQHTEYFKIKTLPQINLKFC